MSYDDTIRELSGKISKARANREQLDNYYRGGQRLIAMGLAVPEKLRALQTVVNWPRVYVDSIANRMVVEGFRLAGEASTDERLWDWWQANNLDVEQKLAYTEAFVQGRCYVTVGYDEDRPDTPVITVESPHNMIAETDPKTRQVTRALRTYTRTGATGEPLAFATLYLPDETLFFEQRQGAWRQTDRHEHRLGRVPVVPMTNRARVEARMGESEMTDVIGLTDAACRMLTNLQAAQELQALPQRFLLGVGEDAFKSPTGETKTAWEVYTGAVFATDEPNATAGQWSAADLRQFNDVVQMYARQITSITGLPPQYLGVSADNPASADAIRMSESRLVMTVEAKETMFEAAWEEVMRLGMLITGTPRADASRLETVWRDAATPTKDAARQSIGNLFTIGLYDAETALERLGEKPEQIKTIMERRNGDPMTRLAVSLGLANESDGIQPGSAGADSASNDADSGSV